jgi:hypothetical protein
VACTTGFGAHSTDWNHREYLLTAGHCGPANVGAWYNTNTDTQDFSYGRYVGVMTGSRNPWLDRRDAGKILANGGSSRIIWKGSTNAPERQVVDLASWNVPGTNVCHEGAAFGEKCGTVSASYASVQIINGAQSGWIDGGVIIEGCIAGNGDSGAPIVLPTAYGQIATGILAGKGVEYVGSETIPFCVGQEIKQAENDLGVVVNSIQNP